jgi:hypothetical protein
VIPGPVSGTVPTPGIATARSPVQLALVGVSRWKIPVPENLFVGLLLDTLIARTLLIPALVAIFGRDRDEAGTEARQSPVKGAREPA